MDTSASHRHARSVAEAAARAAGAVIRRYVGADPSVEAKGTNDFVTEADTAAQQAVVQVLSDAFPDDAILAEEQDDAESASPDYDGRRWIIDPIDGTTNFMHALPPYAVSIALREGPEIVAAVVYDVAHDWLYAAAKDEGATRNGEPIHVNASAELSDALVATGFPYRRFEHMDTYLQVLRDVLLTTRGVRRHGAAAIDLVRVAAGHVGAFYETGLRPWDVAAGALILREAGGTLTDFEGNGALTPVFGRQVMATNGILHKALQPMLAPLIDTHA